MTATVLAPSFGHPQPQSKNPKRLVTTLKQKDEVVKIKSLRVKGQKANFNEAFEASEDWIDNLTIEVENTSGRNIVGVEVRVSIPLNDSGSLCNLVLSHGKVQPSPIAVSDNDLVKPGGMVNLVVSQDDVQWLKRQLKERGSRDSPELKEASVWTSAVFFEDGTVWSGGDTFNPKGQKIVGKSDDNEFLKLGFKATNFTPSFDDTGGCWNPNCLASSRDYTECVGCLESHTLYNPDFNRELCQGYSVREVSERCGGRYSFCEVTVTYNAAYPGCRSYDEF